MYKKVMIVLFALLIGASFCAIAQEVNYFSQWDIDGNFTLSMEEFSAGYAALGSSDAVTELFGKFDFNTDGVISVEEFDAGAGLL